MENNFETIGIVDWYDSEKGYGVLKDIHDHREYFIHQSKLTGQYKRLLAEGDIVMYVPSYDQKRNRETATKIRYCNIASDIQCAINKWIQEDNLTDSYLERIIIRYLNNYNTDVYAGFKDAYNNLIEITWPFLEIDDISIKLFSILRKAIFAAFDQSKSAKLLELTYLVVMEKLPSNCYFQLLDLNTSPYLYFIFALNESDYADEAIRKAIDCSKGASNLLDELIRFAKDINDPNIKESLDNEKSLITSIVFISGIVGGAIHSEIYRYIFSSCDSYTLESLLENGYIHDLDNPILEHENPDCYKTIMIYAYKKELSNHIDIEFIRESINVFTASDLIKLKNHYQLSDSEALDLYRCLVKNVIISKQEQKYEGLLDLDTEIEDLHKWIKDNHSYLAEESEDDYQEFMIWLYKNSQIKEIDEAFVKYYIDRFSTDDIFRLLDAASIDIPVKESILESLFKYKLTNSSHTILEKYLIESITKLCNRAEDLLKEHYSEWFASFCTNLAEEDKYFLWKNKLSDIYPSGYIREKLLGSEEEGYSEFYKLYQRQLMSDDTACDELWGALAENEKVENRPTFYKILYSIKYLVLINGSNKDAIEQKENDYYTLILWFLSYSKSFDFEILCRLFIYFLPKDQVRIIKALFFMAEDGQLQLNIEMLDRLTRVDADLYGLISSQYPEVPIDVSSEIIIKALINITEKGNFSTDKDVLNIVIQAAQHNKHENFKIGSYFDECAGRRIYKWNGRRKVTGCIKQINDSWLSVEIYTQVETWVRNHTEYVWNDDFHNAVAAVKSISGRRWNAEKTYWEIPIEGKEKLFEIAEEHGFEIDGSKNSHLIIFKEENDGKPARVNYCEGRPALKPDEYVGKGFLWCRNSKCYSECVKGHFKGDWQNYTLLDFCRILGIETNSIDSEGRTVKYGKYLSFSSIINRANTIIEHLYCRECREMLEPVKVSNYYTHIVTHFHCTNTSCGKYHKQIYISKCFNWKCNGVIDDRDTQKCPNGWNICPECGSCCSNRIVQQRIDNCREIGIVVSPYFIDFINNNRGHLEKREFYCWKCGNLTTDIGNNEYVCPACGVRYERKKYDFEPRYANHHNNNF